VQVSQAVRAAWWGHRASRAAQTAARKGDLRIEVLPRVPEVPFTAEIGVKAALRFRKDACLVQAMVRQAWYAAHGENRDLVVGVTSPAQGFSAHAWLDGDPPCHSRGFHELLRYPASR
jgi:hypothetical protein